MRKLAKVYSPLSARSSISFSHEMVFAPRFLLLVAAVTAGCAMTPRTGPPAVKLEVPRAFQRSVAVHHFQKGEDVLHIDWMRTYAKAAMTQYQRYLA